MPCQQFGMMPDLDSLASLPPVGTHSTNTMRTDAQHLFHPAVTDVFKVFFRQRGKEEIVAKPPGRVSITLFFLENTKLDAEVAQHFDKRKNCLRAPRDRRPPYIPARDSIPACRRRKADRSSR